MLKVLWLCSTFFFVGSAQQCVMLREEAESKGQLGNEEHGLSHPECSFGHLFISDQSTMHNHPPATSKWPTGFFIFSPSRSIHVVLNEFKWVFKNVDSDGALQASGVMDCVCQLTKTQYRFWGVSSSSWGSSIEQINSPNTHRPPKLIWNGKDKQ